ncbi:MAG: hypothetical protein ACR2JF_10935 [Iamia sp.]
MSRWADNQPPNSTYQWIEYSGGDSHYSVEVTGAAIYIGGHFRWTNNPYGTDSLGPGGVTDEGIVALDPTNGLPLSWNPQRVRGRAVWQLVATPDGLYVASDTDRIAGYRYRGRIAFFPLAGGRAVPQPTRATLPVALDQYAPTASAAFSCTGLDCSYDASASTDPDGTIAPAGWDRVLDGTTAKSRSAVFARTATEDDAGTVIDVTTSVWARTDVVLSAYRGLAIQIGGQTAVQGYTTPSRNATPGAWVLSYLGRQDGHHHHHLGSTPRGDGAPLLRRIGSGSRLGDAGRQGRHR